VYRLLLRVFPRRFREEAETELAASFQEGWTEARGRGVVAAARFTFLIVTDLLRTLVLEWAPAWREPPGNQLWLPSHPVRNATIMETLWQDVRYAMRSLRAAPLTAAVAALTIAVGVGATTTIFSVANALLLRPPPGIVSPGELVTLHAIDADGSSFHAFSMAGYEALRQSQGGLEDVAAFNNTAMSMTIGGEPRLLIGMAVTASYFNVLGTRPVLGRLLMPEDDAGPGGPRVVVLGYTTWLRQFGADSTVIGSVVTLNAEPYTIVGVAEPGFQGHIAVIDVATYIPVALSIPRERVADFENPRSNWLELLGRLAPGTTPVQVEGALSPVLAQFLAEVGVSGERGVDARSYSPIPAPAVMPLAGFLGLLLVLAGLILLIASANVANMLLVRAAGRAREIAVRLAVGASRGRLVRQLITESLLLFLLGGGAGVLLAVWVTKLLATVQLPVPVPVLLEFPVDWKVLLLTLAVTLLTGLVFGLAPAVQATRPDLTRSLKDEPGLIQVGRFRLRGAFVVAQVAGTTLLLVVAGLFVRTLSRAGDLDLGFNLAGLHVVTPELGAQGYTIPQTLAFAEALERRAAALPGIVAVGGTDFLPLNFGNKVTVFAIEGRDPVAGVGRFETDFAGITPGFLGAMEIPLQRGRDFSEADRDGGQAVAIVNETLARRVWPGEDPVGQMIQFGSFTDGNPTLVVGVAADSKYRGLGDQGVLMVYTPMAQSGSRNFSMVVRTAPGASNATAMFRDLVLDLDPNLPLGLNAPYREVIGASLLPNRIAGVAAAVFGGTGLVLAAVGLFGVLAFTVQRRRREIGVRMALGAGNARIRRMVLRDGMRLAALGLVTGLGLAAVAGRLLTGLLFGLSPIDPVTFGGITVLMLGTAMIACLDPVRRALRTEPLEVLRHD